MTFVRNLMASMVLALLLTGCGAAHDVSLGKGAGVVQNFEKSGSDYKAYIRDRPLEIGAICSAYFQVRDYEGFENCGPHLKKAVKLNELPTTYGSRGNLLYNPEWHRITILADYRSQQEQILIELGEYADAAASCDETITKIASLKLDYYQAKDSQVVCGISNALLGNRDKAKQYIASLYEATVVVEERRKGIAAIYMALKQYKDVIETVNGGKDTATENTHKIVEGILTFGFSAVLELAIRETPLAWQRSSTYPQLFMRAKAYFELKDYDRAKKSYDMALNQSTFRDYGSITFTLLHDRGMISEQEGDIITAIDYYRRSIQELEAKRSTINSEGAKMGFVDDKQSVYKSLIDALIKQNRPVEAFEYVERSKARALVDLLASKKTFTGGQTPTQVNAMLAALDAAETNIQQVASASADGQQRRAGSPRSQTSQISQIIAAAPEVGSLVSVDTMSTSDIQAMVKPDEAIIEYFFQGAGALYAFVVRRDGVQVFTLNGAGLNDDVERFRETINAYGSNNWRVYSKRLYDRLIAPLATAIAGKKHLTIVPHGALHYLPFNALRDTDNTMLIERHTIRLLPSASVLKFLNKPSRPTQNLLVFGNPDRDDAPDLPGAESEARAVAQLWDGARVILQGEATESLLKKSASAFRYIHLASHGQFRPDNPMQSQMLLSADNDNDGDLTVSEIYDLNLNADLVILSACQTGLGDVKNGDDVVGLNRGFLYAGAKSIVASLWEVPDNPTKDLMVSFYANLRTMDMRTAMQIAQVSAYKKYKHPLMWAAFQMTGGA